MIATFKYKEKIGDKLVNLLEVRPTKKTNRFLLMFCGTGELGPADGSQINDLDDYGYQRNLGFETDFNIIIPQAVKGYSEFESTILQYLINTYGADIEIVMTGHSLGARQVMEYVNGYRGLSIVPQVKGFLPVAGEMSGPYPTPEATLTLPVLAVHGVQDSSINPIQSKKFVDLLNKNPARTEKAIIDYVDGYNHTSIMKKVFEYDKNSKYYKFIMSCFSEEAYLPVTCTAVLNEEAMIATFQLPEGNKTYKLNAI